jgi:hypothetical protein
MRARSRHRNRKGLAYRDRRDHRAGYPSMRAAGPIEIAVLFFLAGEKPNLVRLIGIRAARNARGAIRFPDPGLQSNRHAHHRGSCRYNLCQPHLPFSRMLRNWPGPKTSLRCQLESSIVEWAETAGLTGFGLSRQGRDPTLRGRKTAPGGKCNRSESPKWIPVKKPTGGLSRVKHGPPRDAFRHPNRLP